MSASLTELVVDFYASLHRESGSKSKCYRESIHLEASIGHRGSAWTWPRAPFHLSEGASATATPRRTPHRLVVALRDALAVARCRRGKAPRKRGRRKRKPGRARQSKK